MPDEVALVVREGNNKDKALWRDDFPVNELSPHVTAIRRPHPVVKDAAGAKIQGGHTKSEALWAPPRCQGVLVSPGLPDLCWRSIENAGNNKFSVGGFRCMVLLCRHKCRC